MHIELKPCIGVHALIMQNTWIYVTCKLNIKVMQSDDKYVSDKRGFMIRMLI